MSDDQPWIMVMGGTGGIGKAPFARLTVPFYGPIAASKSALASLNDAMRMEFAQFGIDVVLIEPGAMKTGIFSTSPATRDSKKPNPRVVVGKGTGALLMLSRVPIRTRDKLIKSALGLTATLKPLGNC
jgi:NAD(P)-dependent dehydrogenase (short-subunit alcohol dehydrogenase family)